MSRTYAGISDSQANAEALARRSSPYTAAHEVSVRVSWDWHKREPSDLREAVRMARKAYSDEVPEKLHDSAIGEDGTPRMNARAVGYIMGSPSADDAGRDPETGQRDLVGYHFTPFRATLERFEHGDAASRRRAAIVRHITIGGLDGYEAAVTEKAHPLDAGIVAEDALRVFLRAINALTIHVTRASDAA